MVRLVQQAGKWFSSSLALGIDVVADITDRLPSDMPCYRDRARCQPPFYFNPHGGPITHSSTGSKLDSRVHPQFPRLFLTLGFVCNSRATFLVIYSGIRHNTYSRYSVPLSHLVSVIEQWSTRLKLLIVPYYFALGMFYSFNLRDTHMFIRGITPGDYPW